ncbi:MAG TPA: DUF3828 domain-containing protein [Pyrinomonadaceae bacterium]|nr:DUF3828 domain-containing protein [Pyrinomonadaceae bacterium]
MKSVKPILFIAVLFLATNFSSSAYGQTASSNRLSPNALVADLYRVHKGKHSPFFQTRSRALLDKYFARSLADMIWKDAVSSKGEVGALDGDPLYDAQDMEIKKFAIGKPGYEGGKARVNVTFDNFGQPKSFVFTLVNGRTGWRIDNIEYGEGRSLRGYLKG